MPSLSSPLRLPDLEDAWLAHPLGKNRGHGGRRSLHGFRYQLALSLERFLDAVDAGKPTAATAFDGLSDLAYLEDGLIYLIQVKATLDRPRLREVALETLALDEFLEDQFPDWRPRTRLRIWCRRRQTPADFASLSVDELELPEERASRWASLRERLDPVEVRSDPYVSLVTRLFREVPDPFVLVDGWLGLLMRLLGEERPSDEICEALLSTWQAQRARLRETPPGRLLQLSDVTEMGEHTDILVGERPFLEDLVRGCFMARPARLGGVLHALDSCFAEAESQKSTPRAIPVVWIRGAPGCGKSVLMLQAVAELTGRPGVVTHLLAPMSRELPEALTLWRETSEQVVIAIDDMYAPAVRDADLWNSVHAAVFEGRWGVPPLVLTCGPDDYFRAFKRQALRGGGLGCVDVVAPALEPSEQDAYHAWFCNRTGTEARPVRETNFASAAFLLELDRHGEGHDIGEFAVRLDDRLASLDVRDAVLTVIAGMTIGFPVPEAVFVDHEPGLDRLVKEGLLRRREGKHVEGLVSFFHPRVAQALYDHLVPADEKRERAAYLGRCFEASRSVSELALLLLTRLDATSKALPSPVARFALETIWQRLAVREVPEVEVSLVWKWFTSAVSHKMSLTSALDRIGRWMVSPGLEPELWALLFQLAVDHGRQDDTLLDEAALWLGEHEDTSEWNYVWQRVWKVRGQDAHLTRLALDWLMDHTAEAGWSYVHRLLYESGVCDPQMFDLGLKGILNGPISPACWHNWTRVESLGQGDSRLLNALVTRQCQEVSSPRHYDNGCKFIVNYIKVPLRQKTSAIAKALQQEIEQPAWSHVWERLVELWPEDAELQGIGRQWLGGREDRPEWNYVWQYLAGIDPWNPELHEIAEEWLRHEHPVPEVLAVRRKLNAISAFRRPRDHHQ